MRRQLLIFLFLQMAAGLNAALSFRLITPPWQAGLVAGTGFILVGLWMVLKTLRWPGRFRFFSFYLCRVHLWLFALPMVLVRLRYLGHDFSSVHFLGIPGPTFHRAAELVYLAMILGTAVDLLRAKRLQS